MIKNILIYLICTLFLFIANANAEDWNNTTPNELLVKFTESPSYIEKDTKGIIETNLIEMNYLNQRWNLIELTPLYPSYHKNTILDNIYKLKFSPNDNLMQILKEYEQLSNIIYITPNYLRQYCSTPNDPEFTEQWALQNIEAPACWDFQRGNKKIIIGIIDSGVDYEHPDLKDNIWINTAETGLDSLGNDKSSNGIDDDNNGYIDDYRGWDFTDAPNMPGTGDYTERDNDPYDDNGHGTHVAGIVGAVANNNEGISGILWDCQLMSLRAGFSTSMGGYLQDDDIASAIVYASDNDARVINMSFGDYRISPVLYDAILYAYSRGCILVAAAGNEGGSDEHIILYPARFNEVICVSNTDRYDHLVGSSSYGASVDIAAPGNAILSTYIGDNPNEHTYKLLSGTSMASPHIAAAAALLLSENPILNNEEIRQWLKSTADDMGEIGHDIEFGAGRLNLYNAIRTPLEAECYISYPNTGDGVSEDNLNIIGTASAIKFEHYELDYGIGESPINWYNIANSEYQIRDNILGILENINSMSEDELNIRLRLFTNDNQILEQHTLIIIDHSAPLITHNPIVSERWTEASLGYFVEWGTDDFTTGEIVFWQPSDSIGSIGYIKDIFYNDYHLFNLTDEVYNGTYNAYIISQNTANDSVMSDIFTFDITHTYIQEKIYEERMRLDVSGSLVEKLADTDGDGKLEIIAEGSLSSEYDNVYIYEIDSNNHLELIAMSDFGFLPRDVGDVNGDGKDEILGTGYKILDNANNNFQSILYGFALGSDERTILWQREDLIGGNLDDIDGDGKIDIIGLSDDQIYVCFDPLGANEELLLDNPTSETGYNSMNSQMAWGDTDNDGKLEILAGDTDGEFFIFEQIENLSRTFQLICLDDTLPLYDTRYVSIGDFDGDNQDEFIIGGYEIIDSYDPNTQQYIFYIYEHLSDNAFSPVWSTSIAGVSGCRLRSQNMDDNIDIEIIISAYPDLYIFKYDIDNNYIPIFYRPLSSSISTIASGDGDNDSAREIYIIDNYQLVLLEESETQEPIAPYGFIITPLNEYNISLNWQIMDEADSYKIYRGEHPDSLSLLVENITNTSYLDTTVNTNITYYYALSYLNGIIESQLSNILSATPEIPPSIIKTEFKAPRQISVWFNNSMNNTLQNAGYYNLLNYGLPSSVIVLSDNSQVLLTYQEDLIVDSCYTLIINGLESSNSVPMLIDTLYFCVPLDVSSPYLDDIIIIDKTHLDLYFNEILDKTSAENINNYKIEPNIIIESARQDDNNLCLIHLISSIMPESENEYELMVSNVADTSGNEINTITGGLYFFNIPFSSLSFFYTYPNPYYSDSGSGIIFQNVPTGSIIRIFNLAGEQIREFEIHTGMQNQLLWEIRSSEIASGIYIYVIEHNGENKIGKLAIAR